MDIQDILVGIIAAGALLFVVNRIYRSIKKGSGSGCNCSGCDKNCKK